MIMEDISDIIKLGESETQEFKPAFNTDVIETAVAFANTRGGRILIGVSDTGQPLKQIFGKEVLRDYVNRIATATEPTIIPDAQRIETGNGDFVILSIPEFPLKPTATHTSKPRNKLIAQIFFDMGIIERYGGGIQRILDYCHAENLPAPILENSQGGFRIIFQSAAPSEIEGSNNAENVPTNVPTKAKIITLVREHPGIQRKAIAQALNVVEKTVSRHLASLAKEGQIEHRGSNKTGGSYCTHP